MEKVTSLALEQSLSHCSFTSFLQMEQVRGISFHFRCPERLHYSLDPAFFPSPFAQYTEEFLVGDSVGDVR